MTDRSVAYHRFAVPSTYERQPEPPLEYPIYDPRGAIEIGAAAIK